MTVAPSPALRPVRSGLALGPDTVPLLAGSVHYFRMSRSAWRPALEALRGLGAHFVDVTVPWNVHEKARGVFDFGRDGPRLHLRQFLTIAAEVGLRAIVRVGPRAGAELTTGGIPSRIVWDAACQARSASGAPVIVPALPLAYPLPSIASRAFHDEAAIWLRAVSEELAPLVWPGGPVALVIVDDDGGMSLHHGAHQRDHHDDAIAQYRRFLRQKHGSVGALRRAHGDPSLAFETLVPPASMTATGPDELAPHLDWAEFQEAMTEAALYRFVAVLRRSGLETVLRGYELPAAAARVPLAPARLERVVDVVSQSYRAGARTSRADLARTTTTLVARADDRGVPAFASRISAGFAADAPPVLPSDEAFVVLTALAYGLRGIDLDMAVQRDRWIGGPIDAEGRPRASAAFWTSLFAAFERLGLHGLVRRAPVRIVIPRSLERLARVASALSPAGEAAFDCGNGQSAGLLEGDEDPTRGATAEAELFLVTLERILDRARVPYSVESADGLMRRPLAEWTIVVCAGALDPTLTGWIGQQMLLGERVSVGPRAPERDSLLRPASQRLPGLEHPLVPLVLPRGPATLAELVRATLEDLGVERLPAEPEGVHTTLLHDDAGTPRVLFVINETASPLTATVATPGAAGAADALNGEAFTVVDGNVTLPVAERSVRVLALTAAL